MALRVIAGCLLVHLLVCATINASSISQANPRSGTLRGDTAFQMCRDALELFATSSIRASQYPHMQLHGVISVKVAIYVMEHLPEGIAMKFHLNFHAWNFRMDLNGGPFGYPVIVSMTLLRYLFVFGRYNSDGYVRYNSDGYISDVVIDIPRL